VKDLLCNHEVFLAFGLHSVSVGAKQVPLALSTTWYHYIEMLMEIQCNQKFMVENVRNKSYNK
jgi:hypothetical protein